MKYKIVGILIFILMSLGGISGNAFSFNGTNNTNPSNCSTDIPPSFDLRNVDGNNFITNVRNQNPYGTCWAFAEMAAIESNLLITGNWKNAGENGEPDLSESHIDWWNGFNSFNNFDIPRSDGLTVHQGGECRTASAYFSRGDGAIREIDAPYEASNVPPEFIDLNYHYYYVNDIEWYDIGENLSNMDLIKNKIMTHGPIIIAFCSLATYLDPETWTFYQPPSTDTPMTHNVAIIGWDDNKTTAAPEKGAWLCKNSWSSTWGLEGYCWISYYDKYCCHYNDREWTASFQKVERMPYNQIYYHDYHGWQATLTEHMEAFNAFYSTTNNVLHAVSFFTPTDNEAYIVRIYDSFEDNELKEELSSVSGTISCKGFHTIHLTKPIYLLPNDNFYIYLKLSNGGQPYDRTIEANEWWGGVRVESISHPGESYFYETQTWHDLYDVDPTANFCIKGLATVTNPPNTPTIIGEINGDVQNSYNYYIQATDPDQDDVQYCIDWGDNTTTITDLYKSGVEVVVSHTWDSRGTYNIKVKTVDEYGAESDWATLTVTMPCSYNKPILQFFELLFQRFPNAFPLLRQLMGY